MEAESVSWGRRDVKPLRKSVIISICSFCSKCTVCSKMSSLELRAVLIGEVSKRVLVIELLFRRNSYNQVALCAEILS